MKQPLFADLKPDERLAALQESASQQTTENIERALTDGQIADYKNRLTVIQTRDMEIEDAIKEFTKPLTEERKDIKSETRSTVQTLKRGFIDSEEPLFQFYDHIAGAVDYYDVNGEHVKTRKMRPEERQTQIFTLGTGTGG